MPLDRYYRMWEVPTMNATLLDDRRRLVMPTDLPPKSAVTVQRIDDDTWLVKRVKPSKSRMVMLMPDVTKLAVDTEWQAVESRIVAHTSKKVTPFEE